MCQEWPTSIFSEQFQYIIKRKSSENLWKDHQTSICWACAFPAIVTYIFLLLLLLFISVFFLNFFWRFKPLRAIRDSEENSLFTCASFAVRSRTKYSVIGSGFNQTRITKDKDVISFKAVSFKILETFEEYAQSSHKTKAIELLPKVTNHSNFWRILFELLSHLKYNCHLHF